MKTNTHPTYYEEATVICVCGNKFTVGSTKEKIHVELCYKCHPFYTGEVRFLDKRSTIDRFQKKREQADAFKAAQTKKVEDKKKKDDAPKSLRDMLMSMK